MKKFYSFIAVASMMLTSVIGFTSCDKNDDAFDNQTPVEKNTDDKVTPAEAKTSDKTSDDAQAKQQTKEITLGQVGLTRELGKAFEDPEATFTVSNPEGLEVTVTSSDEFIHVSPEYFDGFKSTESTSFKTSAKAFVVHAFPNDKLSFDKAGSATITVSDSKSTSKVTMEYKNDKAAIVGYMAWASWSFTYQSLAQ